MTKRLNYGIIYCSLKTQIRLNCRKSNRLLKRKLCLLRQSTTSRFLGRHAQHPFIPVPSLHRRRLRHRGAEPWRDYCGPGTHERRPDRREDRTQDAVRGQGRPQLGRVDGGGELQGDHRRDHHPQAAEDADGQPDFGWAGGSCPVHRAAEVHESGWPGGSQSLRGGVVRQCPSGVCIDSTRS